MSSERLQARSDKRYMAAPHRMQKVQKSMARIKRVLSERKQAIEEARAFLRARATAKRALFQRMDRLREEARVELAASPEPKLTVSRA